MQITQWPLAVRKIGDVTVTLGYPPIESIDACLLDNQPHVYVTHNGQLSDVVVATTGSNAFHLYHWVIQQYTHV